MSSGRRSRIKARSSSRNASSSGLKRRSMTVSSLPDRSIIDDPSAGCPALREETMAALEVKVVERLLGTSVAYAYAVKAGPWIFLTGHEAFDFDAGITEAVAGPQGFPLFGRPRWRREGDFILQRMQRILREFGSDLAHGVRPDQVSP